MSFRVFVVSLVFSLSIAIVALGADGTSFFSQFGTKSLRRPGLPT